MSVNAIIVDIFLTSQTMRIADRDLYISDVDYSTDNDGEFIVDGSGNYLTTSGTGADLYYKKALMDAPSISKQLPDGDSGIVSERSISLKISDNQDTADDQWVDIVNDEEIRGKEIKLYRYEDGVPFFSCWGIITGYFLTDHIEISVTIFDNDSLEIDLPKHTVTSDRFTATAMDSGKPVNICFGRCVDVPLPNIQNDTDDDYYDYLIGYGTIEDVWEDEANNRGVRRNGVLVDTSEYTVYDGSQASPFAGYAFIRFTVEQKSFSNSYFSLTADIKGLELGGSTANRNFATVLYNLITNSTWGLGQSANLKKFEAAATYLSTNWLCDGAITSTRQAGDVINDLLFNCRGILDLNQNGERTLDIAQADSSVATFGDNDGYYNNAETLKVYTASTSDALKNITVKYGHEPGLNELAYELTETAFSSFGIDRDYSLNFCEDAGTAKRIISYIKNKAVWSDKWIDIKASREFKEIKKGNIITYKDPRRNIDGDFIIHEAPTNNRDDYRATLRAYHANIYQIDTLSSPLPILINGVPTDINSMIGTINVGTADDDVTVMVIRGDQASIVFKNSAGDTERAAIWSVSSKLNIRSQANIEMMADGSGASTLSMDTNNTWLRSAVGDILELKNTLVKLASNTDIEINANSGSGDISLVGDTDVDGDLTADSYADHTPAFEGDALAEIAKIKSKDGEIDHDSLPEFARTTIRKKRKAITPGDRIPVDIKDAFETIEEPAKIKHKIQDGGIVALPVPPKKIKRLKKGIRFDEDTGELYTQEEAIYVDVIETPGRNIGAMLSVHDVAIQQIIEQLNNKVKK